MAIRFPKDSPYWPLPADYPTLGPDSQRKARLNAVFLRETREDVMASWATFRACYLAPPQLPLGLHYKQSFLPSPQFHYDMVADAAFFPRVALAAPRSAAKSTIVREMNLIDILTAPYFEVALFLAKQDFVTAQFDIYKTILESDNLLTQDFTWYWRREMGINSLKPRRGSGTWSSSTLRLGNGSALTGMPIMGASLGKRPHRIRFDDVERDDSLLKEASDRIDSFAQFLFNVVDPMIEEGCSLGIYGTLLSNRSFLYYLQTTKDPRIADFYHRTLLSIDGGGQLLWKEKFSEEWIKEAEARLGVAAVNTQFRNIPSTEGAKTLTIGEQPNGYHLEDQDDAMYSRPLSSRAKVVSYRCTARAQGDAPAVWEKITRDWSEVASRMYRFITVDSAPTISQSSDFSCIHVMGFENSRDYRDTLWSLDLFLDKVKQSDLVHMIYKMARKWQVRCVGIESYGVQLELYERLRQDLPALYSSDGYGNVTPGVLPIKFPSSMSKPDKIKGMEWRFENGSLKLPTDRMDSDPAYKELRRQIVQFTYDMRLLAHDDAIDTLAMSQAIGKPRHRGEPDVVNLDPIETLKEGRMELDDGRSVFGMVNLQRVDSNTMNEILSARRRVRLGYLEEENEGKDMPLGTLLRI